MRTVWILLLVLAVLSSIEAQSEDDPYGCGVRVVSRGRWMARSAVRFRPLQLPVNHVIVLHTVTHQCRRRAECLRSVQGIQDLHMDERGWWDIAYNFLIGADGLVYEGRGWNRTGAHSVHYNYRSVGVAFIGNFQKDTPTQASLDAAQKLIQCGIKKGYLTAAPEIHGHRDVSCTLSPGQHLYALVRNWDNYKGGRLRSFNCQPLEPPTLHEDIVDYD